MARVKTAWMKHFEPEESTLPVPRLEMRWTRIDDDPEWSWLATYSLIYRHFLGHLVGIPMGQTRRGGGAGRPPIGKDGVVDTPFRDGCHIACDAYTLNLPAVAVWEDHASRIEPRAPTPPISDSRKDGNG